MENNNDFENQSFNVSENGKGGSGNDNEMEKNTESGKEENVARNGEEAKTFDEKAKGLGEEGTADSQEKKACAGDASSGGGQPEGSTLNGTPRYGANYTPPYYVPNFTYDGSGQQGGNFGAPQKKQKKKYGIGVIAAVCAVCVLLSATVGAVAGAIAGGALEITDNGVNEVNIIRSDREITVSELPGNTGYSDLTVAQVAALVGETVVEITTTSVQTGNYYGQYITSGAGSGVIFDQQGTTGYIVTNYHVIEGADEISVRIKNNGEYKDYKATYKAGDAAEDIAVITVSVDSGVTLKKAVFVSDSDKLQVGEEVVAIGNPLGQLGGTVTNGIISALDREITIDDNTMTLLQTNAAINPGNSGGGLFNMAGELVGIVNAKQSSTGIEGLGFAIPSNKVLSDVKDILELGYISGRATLGIVVQYGQYNGNTGVFVTDAGSTEFKNYDRITKINDMEISSMSDYNYALKKIKVGETVNVEVSRSVTYYHYQTVPITVTALEDTSVY